MRKIIAVSIFMALIISGCSPAQTDASPITASLPPSVEIKPVSTATAVPAESEIPVPTGWRMESYAEGLEVPWSMVFTSTQRMLVAERGGSIRAILNGQLLAESLFVFEDVARIGGEAGLMGMDIDPQYPENGYVYACYALPTGGGLDNRIVRLIDQGDRLVFDRVILDELPSARNHAGCRLRFGPDGKLYATIGDALAASLAQDADSLAGKILRMNPDGLIPADNPFPGSYIFSLGHRNPQGIDWQPGTGLLFSTEHGPSGFDGPGGGDEINLIEAGGNYGWPLVSHDQTLEGTLPPLRQFTPSEAPASAAFYKSDVLPMFTGNLFFGALRGEGLVRVALAEGKPREIQLVEKIITDVGRVRDVLEGPDGYLYFSTSNRDGRGDARAGDDHIYRIVPLFE